MNVSDSFWDWSKIDDDLKKEVIACYYSGDYGRIMQIHNENKMSAEWYCCESEAIKNHVGDAIEKELI